MSNFILYLTPSKAVMHKDVIFYVIIAIGIPLIGFAVYWLMRKIPKLGKRTKVQATLVNIHETTSTLLYSPTFTTKSGFNPSFSNHYRTALFLDDNGNEIKLLIDEKQLSGLPEDYEGKKGVLSYRKKYFIAFEEK